jgi:hypothetical protein
MNAQDIQQTQTLNVVNSDKKNAPYLQCMPKTPNKIHSSHGQSGGNNFNIARTSHNNLAETKFVEYTNARTISQFQHQ